MSVYQPTYLATGNISPCRICVISGEWSCAQATAATTEPCGVSGCETRYPPGTSADDGFIAQAGQDVPIFTDGEGHQVEVGNTVTAGDYLMSDANGRGITCTTTNYYVGQALESASASGQRIKTKLIRGLLA